MTQIRILAFAGSTRNDSYNKMLVRNSLPFFDKYNAVATELDLKNYPMPLYDGDLEKESGIPKNALKIRELMKSHHGILISCPEYNSAIPAVLKNTIDWVSRPVPDEHSLAAFTGKTAALLSTSPGKLGGLRALISVRSILTNLGMLVVPRQFALGNAATLFGDNGELLNSDALENVSTVVQQLVKITTSINSD